MRKMRAAAQITESFRIYSIDSKPSAKAAKAICAPEGVPTMVFGARKPILSVLLK